jgi:O-antigen/teichoic acid export membrane protein
MLASVLSLLPQSFLRYDVIAVLSAVLSSISLAGPAVLVSLGFGILPIVWFSVATNALACVAWGAVGLRLVAALPQEGPPFAEHRREFIRFSAAVAANSMWTAIQTETSKVVVGVAGGTAQTAFFQVPNLVSTRISGLLSSMSTVLLPTGSQLVAEGEHGQLVSLYERSSRLFYLLNASMTGAVAVFAAPLLTHWVGPLYGATGGLAFTFLMLAVALNATSMAASHLNMALGRPNVNLVFSLINSFINLATVYFFTVWWGIAGTAASGLLAAAGVPVFLHYSHRRVLGVSSWEVFSKCYARITIAVGAVATVSWFTLRPFASSLLVTLGLVTVVGAAGLLASAAFGAFTPEDWASLRSSLRPKPANVSPDAPTSAGGDAGE